MSLRHPALRGSPRLVLLAWLAVACAGGRDDAAGAPQPGAGGSAALGDAGRGGDGAGGASAGGGGIGVGRAGGGGIGVGRAGGGAGAGGSVGGSVGAGGSAGGRCAGLRGVCVELCQAGQCDCHCECRRDVECGSPFESRCIAAGQPVPPCCGTGGQCGPGRECQDPDQACETRGGCGTCVPRCTPDSCGNTDYVCGSAGLCVPARCDTDGYACPPNTRCEPGGAGSDQHGCAHDACASDADCPGGACVNERCHTGAGRCEFITCA